MFRDDIGRILAEARWEEGLSRREVAELAKGKVSIGAIIQMETGKVTPRPQTVYAVCQALGLNPKDYYKDEVPA